VFDLEYIETLRKAVDRHREDLEKNYGDHLRIQLDTHVDSDPLSILYLRLFRTYFIQMKKNDVLKSFHHYTLITMSHKVGCVNVGNTCFMNVVFQGLRHTPEFITLFWRSFRNYDKRGRIISKAFYNLLTMILVAKPPSAFPSLPATVDPRPFVRSFGEIVTVEGGLEYRFGEQMDASEFLDYLFDQIHTYCSVPVIMEITPGTGNSDILAQQNRALEAWRAKYTSEHSFLVDSFFGQTQNITTCMNCNKISSENYEAWTKMEVAIPGSAIHGARAPNLLECIDHTYSEEIIDDWKCESCSVRSSCKKTHRLTRLPTNIVIVLKRFTNSGGKVTGGILWDLDHLDLERFYSFPNTFGTPRAVYKTYAVIEHHGRLAGGHYFMRARQGATWYEYNDSSVREIPKESIVTDNSYIIFATSNPSYDSFHETKLPTYIALAEERTAASAAAIAAASAAATAAASSTNSATASTDPAPPA
jgi:ubiquitin carboxyl-terminal hydrolase 36/42